MDATEHTSQNNIAAFVLGAFINMLAVADWAGISDYAIKAMIGGFIWLIFKIIGDMIMHRILRDQNQQKHMTRKKSKAGEELEANLEDDGDQQ